MLGSIAFNQAMARIDAGSGHELAPEQDEPRLADERVDYAGLMVDHAASLYGVWLSQRSQKHFQAFDDGTRQQILAVLDSQILSDLLNVPVNYSLARINNRLVIA